MTTEEIRASSTPKAAWVQRYKSKVVTPEEAVKNVKSGDKLVIQPGCATPLELIRALVDRKNELEDVDIYHILVVGELPYTEPGLEKHFRHKAFFIGGNTRQVNK